MRQYQIEEIGKWTLRVVLVIGLIVAAMHDKETVTFFCFMGIVASFYLLD